MNGIHIFLLCLAGIFVLLFAARPKRPQTAFTYLKYIVLILIASVVLAPFFWLLCSAFKDPNVLMKYTFLPKFSEWSKATVNLKNFIELFKSQPTMEGKVYFWQYIINSLFLASITTIIQMFFSSMGGYALAKYDFRGKKFVMFFMLASMMIPPIVLLAPVYKLIVNIGLMDTYWALIVPGACSVFGMFLFRQAIVGIPNDLIEAGRIDGCSEFSIYMSLIMPLVRPMTGAFCLVTFLGSWNNFLGPQVYINAQSKLTLPVVLNQYVGVYANQYGVFLAGTLLAIIPPAILFFCLQKEFISGLSSGAVKG
ncbi:MAG: carbohydrate ABC transporter permease [Phycisphaerae bacterium]|jgi:ABC-type glycerol-3-phosphate transport system permease component